MSTYTHGLDKIYEIKTVDLSTIRRMGGNISSDDKKETLSIATQKVPPVEGSFDLGDEYLESLDSFLLLEPIENLLLSQQIEQALREHQIKTVGQLHALDLLNFGKEKHIGQGHLDEIRENLAHFLGKGPLYDCKKVNFVSLLRSTFAFFEPRQIYPILEKHHLEEVLLLSKERFAEVKRLTDFEKVKLLEVGEEILSSGSLVAPLERVIKVYVQPWIFNRLGVATKEEIIERLERVNDSHLSISSILTIAPKILTHTLYEVDEEIFASNLFIKENYQRVLKKALSYFYNEKVSYDKQTLASLIYREFAAKWVGFPEGFIEKVLSYSPQLSCFQNIVRVR